MRLPPVELRRFGGCGNGSERFNCDDTGGKIGNEQETLTWVGSWELDWDAGIRTPISRSRV